LASGGTAAIDPGSYRGGSLDLPLQIETVTTPAPGIRRVVAIVTKEGVWKGVRRKPEGIERAAPTILGKHWTIDHPPKGTSESDLEQIAVGQVISHEFIPGLNKLRTVSDFYVDKLGEDLTARIDRKEPLECSVGFRAKVVPTSGTWHGEMYHAEEEELEFTHVAIVKAGACSWSHGCGVGRHGTDELTDMNDDELTDYFGHQIDKLTELRATGCDQTARYHCRYDLARAIGEHERRDTKPLTEVIQGRDERLRDSIDEAREWYLKFSDNHSAKDDSIEESGGMAEGDEVNELLDIGTVDQLEAYLNQLSTMDDEAAKLELAVKVLEKLLSNAKDGVGMFAKPVEEGEHSVDPIVKKVYLKPVIKVEAGHEEDGEPVTTIEFVETEDEGVAMAAVDGLVVGKTDAEARAKKAEADYEGLKDKLTEALGVAKQAESKIREGLIDRMKALPGMDDEAIKAYDDMDNGSLELVVFGMERVRNTSAGEEGAEAGAGAHSAGDQKTNFKAPKLGGKQYDFAADKKDYDELVGRRSKV